MAEAWPFLQRVAETFSHILDFEPAKELLQVAYEEAMRIEDKFDPSGKAKFTTFLWHPVTGAMKDYVRLDRRDARLIADLLNALAKIAPTAWADGGETPDLFDAAEEDLAKQFHTMKTRLMGEMFIEMMRTQPDAEAAYLAAEERALMEGAMATVLDEFEESDRVLIRRAAIGGEPLKAVLKETPPWDEKPYETGWRHFQALKDEVKEAFWARGIRKEDVAEYLGRR